MTENTEMTGTNTPATPDTAPVLPDGFGGAFITALRDALAGAAPALGDLDRRAGDGDFGDNVRTAMRNLDRELDGGAPADYRSWVTAMSRAWLGVGGTSGPLLGMFFRDLAKAADGGAGEGAGASGEPSLAQFAEALAAGQAVIQRYGEAEVGDKTMVDALAPAVDALRSALADGEGAGAGAAEALAAAEQAAADAARGTAEIVARRGRASYVGEVARGVIDPGAAAMALVLAAARTAAEGGDANGIDTAWIA